VSPPRADPFKPVEGRSFTKGEVNRAGRLAERFVTTPGTVEEAIEVIGVDVAEVIEAFRAITWWRSLHARPLSSVAAGLRYHVAQENGKVNGRIDVAQRLKRRPTMVNKLRREPSMQLTQFHDIGGVRALLPTLEHISAVRRRLQKTWTIIKTRDYIAAPKDSGYRALHLVVRRSGYAIEVQLRTPLQDAWANQVEDDGRQIGMGLKFGAGTAEINDYYVTMSDAFAYLDRREPIPDELAATLNERYAMIRGILPREQ
jgi:putative GTP pyrophosphokinase